MEDVGDNYLARHPQTPASLVQRLQQELDKIHQEGAVQQLIQHYTQQQ